MAIIIKLDALLHDRQMTLTELSERIDLTLTNLSMLKTGKAKAIPLLDAQGDLPRARLPAGRPSRLRITRTAVLIPERRRTHDREGGLRGAEFDDVCRSLFFGALETKPFVKRRSVGRCGTEPQSGERLRRAFHYALYQHCPDTLTPRTRGNVNVAQATNTLRRRIEVMIKPAYRHQASTEVR